MERVDLGTLSDLALNVARFVPFDGPAPNKSIIVVRSSDGVRAYWNVCRHLPVPLDSGTGQLPRGTKPGELMCGTHGARFRMEDGLCIFGPCRGAILDEVKVEVDRAADRLWALV